MGKANLRDDIVDTALRLANERSWEALRLHEVAAVLNITLDDLRAFVSEKEDLVDAWFDRADAVMLTDAAQPEFATLPTRERLARAITTWLAALAPYRRVTRQMVVNKFEPGHLHYQIAGAMRVSRTVQWMREAAGLRDQLPWRAIAETVTTGIYLTVFWRWMCDDSADFANTRALLDRLLRRAEQAAHWLPGGSSPHGSGGRTSGPTRRAADAEGPQA